MMVTPEIGIIMPVLNGERFIGDAIRSLQRETDVDFDLIVVDDGSTDGSRAVAEAIASGDRRVRVVQGPGRGVAAARNVGLSEVRAPLVTFLDSDDISVAGRLRRQADLLRDNADVMMVVGELMFVRHIGANLEPAPGAQVRQEVGIVLGSAMLRTELFERHGAFNEEFVYGEDVDLYMRFWEHDEVIHFMPEVVCLYRRHDTNMTNDHVAAKRWFVRCLQESIARRRVNGRPLHLPPMFARRLDLEKEYVEI